MLNQAIRQKYRWIWPMAALALVLAVASQRSGMTAWLIGMLAAISLSGSV